MPRPTESSGLYLPDWAQNGKWCPAFEAARRRAALAGGCGVLSVVEAVDGLADVLNISGGQITVNRER